MTRRTISDKNFHALPDLLQGDPFNEQLSCIQKVRQAITP